MIKANIAKENEKQTIEARGSIPEIAGDIAILIAGIYTQLKAAQPAAAERFRQGVQKMVANSNGPCWRERENQTGIAIEMPGDPHDP